MVKFERLLETYLAYAPEGLDSFLEALHLLARERYSPSLEIIDMRALRVVPRSEWRGLVDEELALLELGFGLADGALRRAP